MRPSILRRFRIRSVRARLLFLACFGLVVAACGGGGSSGGPVGPDRACRGSVEKGFAGVASIGVNEGQGGGGGDGVGDGGGDGGIGVGGALGQFRNVKVTAIDPRTDAVIAEGETDAEFGMATVRLCENYAGPLELVFEGQTGAEYFDEAVGAYVPLPVGRQIRVRTTDVTRSYIGATPYTEAAVQLDKAQLAGASQGTLEPKAVEKSIADANEQVAKILADQLPGIYRATGVSDRFDITGLPIALNDQNANTPGTLVDSNRGRYGAANAGLSKLAGTFLPNDPTPSLTIASQLALDLADGKLDLVGADGCSVGGKACEGDFGTPLAYSYETLWRAKTVATGLTTSSAGDASLSAKAAPIAEYSSSLQKVYTAAECRRFNGDACNAFITRTDAGQIVRLDHRGELKVERSISAGFAPDINWLVDIVERGTIAGTYVEAKVGNRGEIVAVRQDRAGLIYLPPIKLYEVNGREASRAQATEALQASIRSFGRVEIPMVEGRVLNVTLAPTDRTVASGGKPDFLVTRSDGVIESIGIDAAGRVNRRVLPFNLPAINVVFDKFNPPALDAAYGPAGTDIGVRPWFGPRRLFVLSRRGQVRVLLEDNGGANGVQLAIAGRVVQLAAESKTGVYALNSDGQVFWLNADQAGRALHTVVPIAIPERICWIARHEAVACDTGTVFSWEELNSDLFFRAPDVAATATPDLTYVPTDVGTAQPVDLGASATRIWRLNSVQEFAVKSRRTGSIDTRGIRYLAVNGSAPIDPDAVAAGARNLQTSRCQIADSAGPVPYIEGWQLRRALKASFIVRGQTPLSILSSGAAFEAAPGRFPAGPSDLFRMVLDGDRWNGAALRAPQQPQEQCQGLTNDSRNTNLREPDSLAGQGFSLSRYQQRSWVQALQANGTGAPTREVPSVTMAGTLGERGAEFFIDLDTLSMDAEGLSETRNPDNPIFILSDNDKLVLDSTLLAWQYSYYSTGNDPLQNAFDEPSGAFDNRFTCADPGACAFVKFIPMAVFGDPYAFRLCFSQNLRTGFSAVGRLTCTTHDFDGSLRGGTGLESWEYPSPNRSIRNLIDFQHLYDGVEP